MGSLVFSTSLIRTEAASLGATPCTLAWTRSQDTNVTGYALYYGIVGSGTTNRVNVGNTNRITLYNLSASSNSFFYAVSCNASGLESPPSTAISYTPQALSTLKLTVSTGSVSVKFQAATNATCHIEYTPTLNPAQWQTLGNATADASGNVIISDPLTGNPATRFYRAVVP
jgi:hypothetical protein